LNGLLTRQLWKPASPCEASFLAAHSPPGERKHPAMVMVMGCLAGLCGRVLQLDGCRCGTVRSSPGPDRIRPSARHHSCGSSWARSPAGRPTRGSPRRARVDPQSDQTARPKRSRRRLQTLEGMSLGRPLVPSAAANRTGKEPIPAPERADSWGNDFALHVEARSHPCCKLPRNFGR
jgi:hypothetical protein